MSIESWSEDILLVDLPSGLETANELRAVVGIVRCRRNCDVIIDFASVETVNSSDIAELMKIRNLLIECECQLVLCNVSRLITGVFVVTELSQVFVFADDVPMALKHVQTIQI